MPDGCSPRPSLHSGRAKRGSNGTQSPPLRQRPAVFRPDIERSLISVRFLTANFSSRGNEAHFCGENRVISLRWELSCLVCHLGRQLQTHSGQLYCYRDVRRLKCNFIRPAGMLPAKAPNRSCENVRKRRRRCGFSEMVAVQPFRLSSRRPTRVECECSSSRGQLNNEQNATRVPDDTQRGIRCLGS